MKLHRAAVSKGGTRGLQVKGPVGLRISGTQRTTEEGQKPCVEPTGPNLVQKQGPHVRSRISRISIQTTLF